VAQDFEAAFAQGVDAILTPTTPSTAFEISAAQTIDPVQLYINDVFTIPASLAGLPAINVPFELSEGLPVGLQLIGRSMKESKLIGIAACLESEEIKNTIPHRLKTLDMPLTELSYPSSQCGDSIRDSIALL
jgi:aspartyl-tRNA(Asn)/glutamyl-tRNA(Gln) amidotransferase subunit A